MISTDKSAYYLWIYNIFLEGYYAIKISLNIQATKKKRLMLLANHEVAIIVS
jgi:hypothetical protein